jgi:hypothetical protein
MAVLRCYAVVFQKVISLLDLIYPIMQNGYMLKIGVVDLSDKTVNIKATCEEYTKKYLGGKG